MRMRHRQQGFSMIEIVVTITVLGLLLLAAMPSIGSWMDNTRIRNSAQSLQDGLQLARNEAVRRNRSVSFHLVSLTNPQVMDDSCALSSTSGSWVVSQQSPADHCSTDPSTTVAPQIVTSRTVGDAGGRVRVSGLQSDGTTASDTVTFNGFGMVTNTGPLARIDIKGMSDDAAYRALQLTISAAGAVRMCDPHVSDANDPRKC